MTMIAESGHSCAGGRRKGKGAELREEIKDITAQIKEAKDRRAQASKELYGLKRAGV